MGGDCVTLSPVHQRPWKRLFGAEAKSICLEPLRCVPGKGSLHHAPKQYRPGHGSCNVGIAGWHCGALQDPKRHCRQYWAWGVDGEPYYLPGKAAGIHGVGWVAFGKARLK